MKKVIVLFLALFIVANLLAQNKELDSLKLLLSKEKTDTGKVNLLINLGSRFGFGNTKNDSAFWYLQQALDLSKKIQYRKGEIYARHGMSNYLFYTGNYPEALKLSLENLKMDKQYSEKNALFFQTRLTAWIYGSMGDPKKNLEYSKQLMVLANSEDFKKYRGNYVTTAYNVISGAYFDLGQMDSALFFKRLIYEFAQKHNSSLWYSIGGNGLGNIFQKKGVDDSAFFYYRIADRYSEKIRRQDLNATANQGIAKIFFERNQIDSAFFYAEKALRVIQNTDDPQRTMEIYSLLADLYKSNGQYDSAYKYMESYVAMKDSVFNQTKIAQAQNLSFSQTLQQQQLEQAKKDAQQQYDNRLKIYILAAVILIFLIIALLLFRNNQNKRKANLLLSKQKEEIEGQKKNVETTLSELKSTQKQLIQSEKMASLGELTAGIAHEIQNPLNFVNNFSDVNRELIDEMQQEMDKGNLEDAKDISNDIKDNEEKINHHGKRADAIVKGMLQHSRTSTGVKEPTEINALCDEYLRLSYHGMRAKDKSFNATMRTDFDETIGKINIIPQDIGRVLLNLINNAFYAVNEKKTLRQAQCDGYQPTVSITTKKLEKGIEIKVADNGNGIPDKIKDKIFQPFFTTKPTGEGTGLGLSLSYDIVKAHGGELKVETKENEGIEFVIFLHFN